MKSLLPLVSLLCLVLIPLTRLISPVTPYPSRAACWLYHPILVPVHDITNSLIWVEYVIIPFMLLWVGYRAKAWHLAQAFPVLALEGANFIFWCGVTHLFARTEIYKSTPWAAGIALIICAASGLLFITHFVLRHQHIILWLQSVNRGAEIVRQMD